MGRRQALAAVLLRHADAREPRAEQHPLDLALAGDLGEVFLLILTAQRLAGAGRSAQVRADPLVSAPAKVLDALDVLSHTSTSPPAAHKRCRLRRLILRLLAAGRDRPAAAGA